MRSGDQLSRSVIDGDSESGGPEPWLWNLAGVGGAKHGLGCVGTEKIFEIFFRKRKKNFLPSDSPSNSDLEARGPSR